MAKRNGKIKVILLLVMLAAGVVVYLSVTGGLSSGEHGASGEHSAAAAPSTPAVESPRETLAIAVTVVEAVTRPIQRRVQVVGTLYGEDEIEIAPKVGGRIVRIAHDVGDVVRAGDVLLELDDRDYRLAVTESERSLELDLSKLGLGELPTADFDVRAVPTVVRAKLLEDNLRSALDRTNKLAERNVVTQDQLEQAQTDYRVAQVNTRQAILEAEQTLASIRYRQAILETARQRLQDTQVTMLPRSEASRHSSNLPAAASLVSTSAAPVEYVVAERMVSEGEMVQTTPPTPVFRLVIDKTLKLQATVPERYIGEIKIGQPVELSVEAYPGEAFQGTVARLNPTIDHASRTFQVEIHVPNDARRLHPGSFAKAAILTREDPHVVTIPEEALIQFAGVVKLFVVQQGKSHIVPVTPGVQLTVRHGERTENWLEVRGDLQPGDLVVTTGHSQLAEGTPVRIRETPASAAPAASPPASEAKALSTQQSTHTPVR